MSDMGAQDDGKFVRQLFAAPCDFMLAAADPKQFPATPLAEIAFIGRSNVGKSSLINKVVGRKNVARASNTPGRTQQIVFFNLGNQLILVDLPGYGFAKAPQAEKNQWNHLVSHYFRTRPKLRCVCLLLDGRHGALAKDIEMMDTLDKAAANYRVVLTKADKVKPAEVEAHRVAVTEILKTHGAAHPEVMVTSADKGLGIDELRAFMAGFVE